jgi:hypothetical protein
MPAAIWWIMPARSINWWLTVSASEGTSRSVWKNILDMRISSFLAVYLNDL